MRFGRVTDPLSPQPFSDQPSIVLVHFFMGFDVVSIFFSCPPFVHSLAFVIVFTWTYSDDRFTILDSSIEFLSVCGLKVQL